MNKKLKAQIIKIYGAQYRFARALDIQETVISAVINGRRELKADEIPLWSKLLNCNVQEFFKQDARN